MQLMFTREDVIKMLNDIKKTSTMEEAWCCCRNYDCNEKYLNSDKMHNCLMCGIDTFLNELQNSQEEELNYFFKDEDFPNNKCYNEGKIK